MKHEAWFSIKWNVNNPHKAAFKLPHKAVFKLPDKAVFKLPHKAAFKLPQKAVFKLEQLYCAAETERRSRR